VLAVAVVEEDVLAAVAAGSNVMNRSGILDACLSCHEPRIPRFCERAKNFVHSSPSKTQTPSGDADLFAVQRDRHLRAVEWLNENHRDEQGVRSSTMRLTENKSRIATRARAQGDKGGIAAQAPDSQPKLRPPRTSPKNPKIVAMKPVPRTEAASPQRPGDDRSCVPIHLQEQGARVGVRRRTAALIRRSSISLRRRPDRRRGCR
jgi:hypothetical protein